MSRVIELFFKKPGNRDPFSKIPLIEPGLRSVVWGSPENSSSITVDERNDSFYFSATYVNEGSFQEVKLDKNPDGTFTRRITTPRLEKKDTTKVVIYDTVKDSVTPEEGRIIMKDLANKTRKMRNLI